MTNMLKKRAKKTLLFLLKQIYFDFTKIKGTFSLDAFNTSQTSKNITDGTF